MLETSAVNRKAVTDAAGSGRTALDVVLAPLQLFERPLALLRITNSHISLFHVRFTGDRAKAMGVHLLRLFDLEAMIEPLVDGSFALLFVRRGEDESAVTSRVLQVIRESMGVPAFEGRNRIDVTVVHRHSGLIGDAEDLFAELAFKVANGASIVAP